MTNEAKNHIVVSIDQAQMDELKKCIGSVMRTYAKRRRVATWARKGVGHIAYEQRKADS